MENLSPMLQQYLSMKKEITEDTLLFFRLGDFYELFFKDAEIVSRELDLILTSRAAGNNQKAPMCGVPHHAATSYIQRLVEKGYKVAIAQQMEDPATTKGLVKRAITKIITQGTNLDIDESISARLAVIDFDLFYYYVGYYDITNNHLYIETVEKEFSKLLSSLKMNFVSEILVSSAPLIEQLQTTTLYPISQVNYPPLNDKQEVIKKVVQDYIHYTQKQTVLPQFVSQQQAVLSLDSNTISNLELITPLRTQSKSMTLFAYLNKTQTPMGKRLLKDWIVKPLVTQHKIEERQQAIAWLIDAFLVRHQLKELLNQIYDIERISTKITYQSVVAQDLIRLKESLKSATLIQKLLIDSPLQQLTAGSFQRIISLIENTLVETPPTFLKDGGTIKEGVNVELDRLRGLLSQGNQWLLEYEQQQKEKTGIKNLKVGYSRAFGFYIEVSKGQMNLVKEDFGYMPRQTLTNAQRYVSLELKQQEEEIEQAKGKVLALEQALFDELIQTLQQTVQLCHQGAQAIAEIDCLCSLAELSSQKGYVRPQFNETASICLKQSKHPILSETLPSHKVIANDFIMDESHNMMILTGPNMGGKSTFMRQVALAIIMAQLGCWVMAERCELPIFDAIYTRMGASDDIVSGQSTFMVEMSEANVALQHATKHSLILFDELGRGTSTYDGMAIARSIIEYITEKIGCKTIFSTHYHELTTLSQQFPAIVNYKVDVDHTDNQMTLLYKLVQGTSDRSYGVHVAQLANLPQVVIDKAGVYLQQYEQRQPSETVLKVIKEKSAINTLIKQVDPNQMTPLEALQLMMKLKEMEDHDE